jgi:hypothetical protein
VPNVPSAVTSDPVSPRHHANTPLPRSLITSSFPSRRLPHRVPATPGETPNTIIRFRSEKRTNRSVERRPA